MFLVSVFTCTCNCNTDDVKAFEQSICGFPPFFLDSQMEARFVSLHSHRVTNYFVALTITWITFLSLTFGSFRWRSKKVHAIWALPYMVGMSTAILLILTYLVIVALVTLRMRTLVRQWHYTPPEVHGSPPEPCANDDQPTHVETKEATARQASFNMKVYHLRWVVLRDVVMGAFFSIVSDDVVRGPLAISS